MFIRGIYAYAISTKISCAGPYDVLVHYLEFIVTDVACGWHKLYIDVRLGNAMLKIKKVLHV